MPVPLGLTTDGHDACRSGLVKRFDPVRGFGFVLIEGHGCDVFLHAAILQESGFVSLSQGDRIQCLVETGPKGVFVARVLAIQTAGADDVAGWTHITGRVKFYNLAKGYGFVRDNAGTEVFVGAKLLKKLGLTPPLRMDQPVRVSASLGRNGLVAETLTFLPEG